MGPFVNVDPDTLPPLHPPTPTPIPLPLPPNLFSSGTSIFKSTLFQAVQTSPFRETVRAPKMGKKGRDKKDKHWMRPAERKKEAEEEERQEEAEQWTKRTANYIYLQISEAY